MAETPRIEVPFYLTTNNYIMVAGKVEVFDLLGINKETPIKENTENLFARGKSSIMTFKATSAKQQTHRQTAKSTQILHTRSAVITTTTKRVKGGYKQVQLAFPAGCLILWATKFLYDEIKNIDKIKPYNGVATWKNGTGGRFGIAKIDDAIISTSVNEFKVAVEAAKKQGRKQGSVSVDLQEVGL